MSKPPYRVVVNWEWTSKCNARCAMCPRHAIADPTVSEEDCFTQTLARLDPQVREHLTGLARLAVAAPRDPNPRAELGLGLAANGLWAEARQCFLDAERLGARGPLPHPAPPSTRAAPPRDWPWRCSRTAIPRTRCRCPSERRPDRWCASPRARSPRGARCR